MKFLGLWKGQPIYGNDAAKGALDSLSSTLLWVVRELEDLKKRFGSVEEGEPN